MENDSDSTFRTFNPDKALGPFRRFIVDSLRDVGTFAEMQGGAENIATTGEYKPTDESWKNRSSPTALERFAPSTMSLLHGEPNPRPLQDLKPGFSGKIPPTSDPRFAEIGLEGLGMISPSGKAAVLAPKLGTMLGGVGLGKIRGLSADTIRSMMEEGLQKAKDPFEKYGLFRGTLDKQPRMEMKDTGVKLVPAAPESGGQQQFKLVHSNPELDLHKIYDFPPVKSITPEPGIPYEGSMNPRTKQIELIQSPAAVRGEIPGYSSNRAPQIILHEVQHIIQEMENFSKGSNIPSAALTDVFWKAAGYNDITRDEAMLAVKHIQNMRAAGHDTPATRAAYSIYKRIAGETEARNVEDRFVNNLYKQHPTSTEDVPASKQLQIEDIRGALGRYTSPEMHRIEDPALREVLRLGLDTREGRQAFAEAGKTPRVKLLKVAHDDPEHKGSLDMWNPEERLGDKHSFKFYDDKGEGRNLVITDYGKKLYVDWIGTEPSKRNLYRSSNSLNEMGPRPILDLARQIKDYFPEAETIGGFRIGGARAEAAKEASGTGRHVNQAAEMRLPELIEALGGK